MLLLFNLTGYPDSACQTSVPTNLPQEVNNEEGGLIVIMHNPSADEVKDAIEQYIKTLAKPLRELNEKVPQTSDPLA